MSAIIGNCVRLSECNKTRFVRIRNGGIAQFLTAICGAAARRAFVIQSARGSQTGRVLFCPFDFIFDAVSWWVATI